MRSILMFAIAASTSIAGITGPARAQDASTATTALQTCLKAVNLLGASMGHTEVKDDQGRPSYRFNLRTSGLDYVATCDAETGIVGDVSPRRASQS